MARAGHHRSDQLLPAAIGRMVRKFDVFPKAVDSELKVRTEIGGLLSIASLSFLVLIIVEEVRTALSPSTSYTMIVNENPLPVTTPVSLSVTVANNCSFLHFECTNLRRTAPLEVQITREAFTQQADSCAVHARLRVPAVPGSCHVGLGDYFAGEGGEHSTCRSSLQIETSLTPSIGYHSAC
jgi:hypothetical protein